MSDEIELKIKEKLGIIWGGTGITREAADPEAKPESSEVKKQQA